MLMDLPRGTKSVGWGRGQTEFRGHQSGNFLDTSEKKTRRVTKMQILLVMQNTWDSQQWIMTMIHESESHNLTSHALASQKFERPARAGTFSVKVKVSHSLIRQSGKSFRL